MNIFYKKIKDHYHEVLSSVKVVEVEEKFDLLFSRFFGLYIARVSNMLHMTPNQLTIWSMVVGMAGGSFLYFQEDVLFILIGSGLVVFSGLLDSADGQLARLSGKSSEFGRILDGVADSFVFGTCYIAGTLYYVINFEEYYLIIVTLFAALLQSFKTSLYDFYKSEAHYYLGELESAKIETPEQLGERIKSVKGFWQKFFFNGYLGYTKRQFWGHSRSKKTLDIFRSLYDDRGQKPTFKELYKEKHIPLLKGWALFAGLNSHRFGILIFSLFGGFKLFLFASIVLSFSLFLILKWEKRADNRILEKLGLNPH